MKTPSFSYKNTRKGIVFSILALIAVLIFIVVFLVNPNKPSPAIAGGTSYPASLPAIANGCGDIFRIPPQEGKFGVIPDKFWELNKDNNAINIPTTNQIVIPIFGYMGKEGLKPEDIRFYTSSEVTKTVDRTKLFRSMYEDNILVIWYTTDMPIADIDILKNYANDNPGKVLVHPWNNGGQTMVQGRDVALSKWGISQTCTLFNEDVLKEFITFTEENPLKRETPIPEADMSPEGILPQIDEKRRG